MFGFSGRWLIWLFNSATTPDMTAALDFAQQFAETGLLRPPCGRGTIAISGWNLLAGD